MFENENGDLTQMLYCKELNMIDKGFLFFIKFIKIINKLVVLDQCSRFSTSNTPKKKIQKWTLKNGNLLKKLVSDEGKKWKKKENYQQLHGKILRNQKQQQYYIYEYLYLFEHFEQPLFKYLYLFNGSEIQGTNIIQLN
ncbi:unnamed protein product (macronuclear) [Paramecium tetraurelia]|uniref:Uncharacterized protein n=1 Tax=Paramecium tetraurelia TaxID=5888 RepID=A0DBU5_PARTE|nr:uncharacterized protein GSPATT00015389001 [Paramecium tetraurelia]CAK80512.1 unnamed protein product [Paramecium tetraurelia]|eukprot:XP_001447909.1 hypothetical protein (macronuclear) [Paramecium tetraurelia strain d4-2]